MSDRTSFYPELAKKIAPRTGRLAVLLPGLGAVSTTLIAASDLVRRGAAKPFGSGHADAEAAPRQALEPEFTPIKELVPLADLNDLVFGGWDIFPDTAYDAAYKAGVLRRRCSRRRSRRSRGSARGPPSSSTSGSGTSTARTSRRARRRWTSPRRSSRDIEDFRKSSGASRAVMVWCGSTEVYAQQKPVHATLDAFEKGLRESSPEIPPSMIYAYAAIRAGVPYANGAPNLSVDVPALTDMAREKGVPIAGKDFKTGQTLMKTIIAPG
jgi:myo-inositol-1-phosphate synthase